MLSARENAFQIDLPAVAVSTAASVNRHSCFAFLKLGVEHILTGYDHLLFLFALLVVCRDLRSILTVITCFTIAHSITLALATLDIVRLPGRIVEPMIAASIAYVGAPYLRLGRASPYRTSPTERIALTQISKLPWRATLRRRRNFGVRV
jgi:hydrogenase/urease accessory protein HupE